MSSHALTDIAQQLDSKSVDDWLLENLRWNGAQTLDHLSSLFPKMEEARLLFAIDRLSRIGKVVISPPQGGDYLISAGTIDEKELCGERGGSRRESRELAQSGVR